MPSADLSPQSADSIKVRKGGCAAFADFFIDLPENKEPAHHSYQPDTRNSESIITLLAKYGQDTKKSRAFHKAQDSVSLKGAAAYATAP